MCIPLTEAYALRDFHLHLEACLLTGEDPKGWITGGDGDGGDASGSGEAAEKKLRVAMRRMDWLDARPRTQAEIYRLMKEVSAAPDRAKDVLNCAVADSLAVLDFSCIVHIMEAAHLILGGAIPMLGKARKPPSKFILNFMMTRMPILCRALKSLCPPKTFPTYVRCARHLLPMPVDDWPTETQKEKEEEKKKGSVGWEEERQKREAKHKERKLQQHKLLLVSSQSLPLPTIAPSSFPTTMLPELVRLIRSYIPSEENFFPPDMNPQLPVSSLLTTADFDAVHATVIRSIAACRNPSKEMLEFDPDHMTIDATKLADFFCGIQDMINGKSIRSAARPGERHLREERGEGFEFAYTLPIISENARVEESKGLPILHMMNASRHWCFWTPACFEQLQQYLAFVEATWYNKSGISSPGEKEHLPQLRQLLACMAERRIGILIFDVATAMVLSRKT